MQIVESRSTLDDMPWCRCHTLVVNNNDEEGLHWCVCAFHCRVQLEGFIIWVWELLSSPAYSHHVGHHTSVIRPLWTITTPYPHPSCLMTRCTTPPPLLEKP